MIAETYGGYSDLLSSCSNITTEIAAKCLKKLTEARATPETAKIKTCGFVNTKEGLEAMSAAIDTHGGDDLDILVAISFSDTKAESECVRGLMHRTKYSLVRDYVACNTDSVFAALKRRALIKF